MRKEYKISQQLKRGEDYTLSVQLKGVIGEVEAYLGPNYYIGSTENQKLTFTMSEIIPERTLIINPLTEGVDVDKIQLERGTIATDWGLAPEDEVEYIDSRITIEAGKISTKISNDIDSRFSEISHTIEGFEANIRDDVQGLSNQVSATAGEIRSKLSKTDFNGNTIASEITRTPYALEVIANSIDLTGKVTFNSFDSGTKRDLQGAIRDADSAISVAASANSVASSARNTANSANSTASTAVSVAANASSRADRANDVIGGWTYRNTTEIDGGAIRTGTVTADDLRANRSLYGMSISGGSINIGNGSFTVGSGGNLSMSSNRFAVDQLGNMTAARGGFSVPWNADGVYNRFNARTSDGTGYGSRWKFTDAYYIYQDSNSVAFYQSGQNFRFERRSMSSVQSGQFDINSSGGNISLNPGNGNVYVTGNLRPTYNRGGWLGQTSLRWDGLMLSWGSVNESSDSRLKEDIQNIPDELVEFFKDVKPKTYVMGGMRQFGYIAQDVERALFRYATSEYGIEAARRNKEVFNIVGQDESYLSLVYRQVTAIKDAQQDKVNKENVEIIKSLEERVSKLENKGVI